MCVLIQRAPVVDWFYLWAGFLICWEKVPSTNFYQSRWKSDFFENVRVSDTSDWVWSDPAIECLSEQVEGPNTFSTSIFQWRLVYI